MIYIFIDVPEMIREDGLENEQEVENEYQWGRVKGVAMTDTERGWDLNLGTSILASGESPPASDYKV